MSEGPSIGAGKSLTLRTRSCPYPSINAAITYAVYFVPRSFVELSNIRPHSQQVSTAGMLRASKTRNHPMSRDSAFYVAYPLIQRRNDFLLRINRKLEPMRELLAYSRCAF